MARQQLGHDLKHARAAVGQLLTQTLLNCQLKLWTQPAVTKELRPVLVPAVGLRRAADQVVAAETVAWRGDRVQACKTRTETSLAACVRRLRVEPLEREERRIGRLAAPQHPRHAQRVRVCERGEPGRLGGECRRAGARGNLDEQRAVATPPCIAFADAAA